MSTPMFCREHGPSDSDPLGSRMHECKHTELEKMTMDRDNWKKHVEDLAVLARFVMRDLLKTPEGQSVTGAQLKEQLKLFIKESAAEVLDYRNVLEQIATMPHLCIFCGWNVGGVPKGIHNTGCLFANTLDKYLDKHLRSPR